MNLNVQWLSIPRKNEVRGNIFSSTFAGCIILHICNDHFYSSFLVWVILEETYRAKSVRECYLKMNGRSLWILSCFKFITMHLYFKKYIHTYQNVTQPSSPISDITFVSPSCYLKVVHQSLYPALRVLQRNVCYIICQELLRKSWRLTNLEFLCLTPADIKSCYKVIVIKTVRYWSKVKWIGKWNNYGV